ncbi:DUF1822 family protein [Aerosakkonema funiforme]|uniref:DUF1822 family protein n=1 Tax=Aerosakkonema funiforme FACHB-1375 TaxID=2949571 RepID=A0A926VHI4_9CYAN|nr:DUF1822 family protein [Aerosakkonema funiforme]MBD2183838.1 DUF1822 family protein [Aerosakkonema funiforme FACHB-1375]
MTYYPKNSGEVFLDFEALSIGAISLLPEEVKRAVEIGNQVSNEAQQWQTYLNALALFAFEKWLNERSAELSVNTEQCSILQPYLDRSIEAVCNLKIGDFRLCLIATGSQIDDRIFCPRAAIELPEFAAHFYVWLEIQEEYEQAIIRGFLRYDRLVQLCSQAKLQPESDWTYSLPLDWFDNDSDRLLLYLCCLEATAIALPEIPQRSLATLLSMQDELAAILFRLESGTRPLWEVLNWKQASAILTSKNCLDSARHLDRSQPEILHLENLLQLLTRPALNVGLWLEDKMNELAEGLAWVLMPVFAPAGSALRCSTQEFETIITELGSEGIEIPLQARGAYRELKLGDVDLRLYAVTWPFLSPENVPEWTLMLILGAYPGEVLPPGLKLGVSDSTGILVQRQTGQNSRDGYIYAQIAGTWDEKFLVSVTLKDRARGKVVSVTLPPFAFRLDR